MRPMSGPARRSPHLRRRGIRRSPPSSPPANRRQNDKALPSCCRAKRCQAEVFLLAVVELASVASVEGGLGLPVNEQIASYQAVLDEGVERLKALGFSPTERLGMGAAGPEIAEVAEEIGANLVVVGHRPTGPLARWWFGSVGTYLVKHLRCSVL